MASAIGESERGWNVIGRPEHTKFSQFRLVGLVDNWGYAFRTGSKCGSVIYAVNDETFAVFMDIQ